MRKFFGLIQAGAFLAAALAAAAYPTPLQLYQANEALQAGEADKALALLNMLTQPGDVAEAFNLRCRVEFTLEEWDRAANDCGQAVKMDGANSMYHLWLGRALGEKASRASGWAGRRSRRAPWQSCRITFGSHCATCWACRRLSLLPSAPWPAPDPEDRPHQASQVSEWLATGVPAPAAKPPVASEPVRDDGGRDGAGDDGATSRPASREAVAVRPRPAVPRGAVAAVRRSRPPPPGLAGRAGGGGRCASDCGVRRTHLPAGADRRRETCHSGISCMATV